MLEDLSRQCLRLFVAGRARRRDKVAYPRERESEREISKQRSRMRQDGERVSTIVRFSLARACSVMRFATAIVRNPPQTLRSRAGDLTLCLGTFCPPVLGHKCRHRARRASYVLVKGDILPLVCSQPDRRPMPNVLLGYADILPIFATS